MNTELLAQTDLSQEGIAIDKPYSSPVAFDILPFVDTDMVSPLIRQAKKIAGPNQVGQVWTDLNTAGMPFAGYYQGSGLTPGEIAQQIDSHGEYLLCNLATNSAQASHLLQVVEGEVHPDESAIITLYALEQANRERYREIRSRFPPSVYFREQLNKQVCMTGALDYKRTADGELIQEVRFAPASKSLRLSNEVRTAAGIVLSKGSEASRLQKDISDAGGDPLLRAFATALIDPYVITEYDRTENGKQVHITRAGNAAYRDYLKELQRFRRLLVPQERY